ncbi:hypothetical protein TNCV_919241 [Trichonephila clavipes]|nr:hypothetical protein TNCV_919241 [Trichonephila clavipes]
MHILALSIEEPIIDGERPDPIVSPSDKYLSCHVILMLLDDKSTRYRLQPIRNFIYLPTMSVCHMPGRETYYFLLWRLVNVEKKLPAKRF